MNETIDKSEIDLKISYVMKCRLRHAVPLDFKRVLGADTWFKKGVVFFLKNEAGDFHGPYVTGFDYDHNDIAEHLSSDSIFVMR